MKKGGWSKGRWSKRGAVVKRGVGKNYYVELFGEILAITKMANSGLDRDGAISPTQSRNRDLNLTFRWPGQ